MEIQEIPVNKISPSPFQPRETFEKVAIQKLADSIREFDLLNPILVKPIGSGNYQIIAGERRWRAAQYAGFEKIAAIIKDVDDRRQQLESLIENIHRKDLTMPEKGRGVLEIFKYHEIDMKPRELAKAIASIREKLRKGRKMDMSDEMISTVFSKLHVDHDITRLWLESTSVDQEIIKDELEKPPEERIPESTLARLSTIEDESLQKKVYSKIVEQDMGQSKASKFITQIKKIPKEEREAILTSSIPVEIIGDQTEGYSIEIPEDQIEEIRHAVEMGEKESAAILGRPIVKERGRHRRNWQAHLQILTVLDNLFCPYCGERATSHLRFVCHEDKSIEKTKEKAKAMFEEATKREKADPKFLKS